MRTFFCAVVINILFITLQAQTDIIPADTVFVSKGSVIIIDNIKYQPLKDTVFVIPKGIKYKLRLSQKAQSDVFYDSLFIRASQRKWVTSLHNIVITSPQTELITDTIHLSESVSPFIPYGGQIIRDIKILRLKPFGPTIFDTTSLTPSSLENFGNRIHVDTREKVIRNHLLFREGDFLNPLILSDNERIIRQLPFIEDVRILILEIPEVSGYVDVLILTKDAFSIGMGGEMTDLNAGNLQLFEKNLAGLGHQLHGILYWNGEKNPWYGSEFFYIINNIGHSFINSKIRFANVFEKETYEVAIDRRFFTPSIKYAGAVNFNQTRNIHRITISDTMVVPTDIRYNLFDGWLGKSIPLTAVKKYTSNRINLVLASRIEVLRYFQRPEVTENTFYQYHNKTLWLSSISLSQQRFFRSNLIYSFGRTEDIAHGTMLNFIFGPEFGEFDRRFYTGVTLSRGGLIGNVGYLYSKAEVGGYTADGFFPDQGIFHIQASYISNLLIVNRFKLRHFVDVSLVKGYNRFSDEYITINERNGIRGYTNDFIKGTRKLTMNYEIVTFSPYYFYGFRFAFFGFTDLGLISFTQPLLQTKLHSGFGIGVRIKNERLVFETIQIRVGYYPTLPDDLFPFTLDISGEQKLDPMNFYVKKPDPIRFE